MGFINTAANVFSAGSNHHTSKHTKVLAKDVKRRRKADRRYRFSHDVNGQWVTTGFHSIRTPVRVLAAADRERSVAAMAQARPGWYVPHGELQRRWWDGARWTEHTYPLPIEHH